MMYKYEYYWHTIYKIQVHFDKSTYFECSIKFVISFENYIIFYQLYCFPLLHRKKSELNLSLPTFYYYFTYGG